ncbi:unnamed protein product [Linum tenue]|uniref:Uncharacterized protein n=1 Tax=Linum tenue TaxID=586396 RepID=A0AAV0MJR9_9ROSI|nr:unnamed protein product [Linum tenue]
MRSMKVNGIAVATAVVACSWLSFLAPTSNAQNFDFFYLVMQWPPAFCNQPGARCKPRIPRTFTIHGMWPQTNSGGSPQDCPGAVPDVRRSGQVDEATLGLMDRQWPNLKRVRRGNGNSQFWTYEWNKHGTCSGWSLQSYFRATVDRASGVDLLRELRSNGIQPDNQLYARNRFRNALGRYSAVISCNNVRRRRTISKQIHEIWLCVHKDGSRIFPCARGTRFRNCGGGAIVFSS